MEKLIQEFKITETDEGFRIEIKGDKERMRAFVERVDPRKWGKWVKDADCEEWDWSGAAFRRHMRRKVRTHRHGFGRFFFGMGMPPWMWAAWDEEEEDEDEGKAKSKGASEGQEPAKPEATA
ncbi:MAG: hypothetical protein JXB47_03135 [Anaerolineae bacterium]|nr:hypothetical protein [Anaerolineae bacterium]